MNKKLRTILERDNYICGLHVGGCGKKIDCKKDKPTIDHIWSKSYLKNHKNKTRFRKKWNYQPMCEECNNKKGGQVTGFPNFRCNCHYIYAKENGDYLVWYKENEKWSSVWLTNIKSGPREDRQIVPPIQITSIKRHRGIGFKIGSHGHIVYGHYPFERILGNARNLFAVGKLNECAKECKEFKTRYIKDGGVSFRREAGEEAINRLKAFHFYSIVSNFHKKQGLEGLARLGNDYYGDKTMIKDKLQEEMVLMGEDNFESVFPALVGDIGPFMQWLLDSGNLEKQPATTNSKMEIQNSAPTN